MINTQAADLGHWHRKTSEAAGDPGPRAPQQLKGQRQHYNFLPSAPSSRASFRKTKGAPPVGACRRFVSNRFKLGELFGIMQRGTTNLHWVRVCRRSCAVRYRERRARDERKERESERDGARERGIERERGKESHHRATAESRSQLLLCGGYGRETVEKRTRVIHFSILQSIYCAVWISQFTTATEPFNLVHTDMWGPAAPGPAAAHGDLRFAIIFVDDATRYRAVYLMANKGEATACLKKFQHGER